MNEITTQILVPGEHVVFWRLAVVETIKDRIATMERQCELAIEAVDEKARAELNDLVSASQVAIALLGEVLMGAMQHGSEEEDLAVDARMALLVEVLETVARGPAPEFLGRHLEFDPIGPGAREVIDRSIGAITWALDWAGQYQQTLAAGEDATEGGFRVVRGDGAQTVEDLGEDDGPAAA